MYNIYISQETKERLIVLKLPVAPEEIEISQDMDNKRYMVLNLGEITRHGDIGLRTFDIKSHFPFAMSPDTYIDIIKTMIANKLPVRFIMERVAYGNILTDINIEAIIDSFTYSERGGEIGDIYYTLKFTEYRKHETKVISGA